MICFRDKTFCAADCATADCHRKLTDQVRADARRWWGKPGAPIAVANLAANCPDHTPVAEAAAQ
ncbi:hypothetical protein [Phenylobacterium sp.]|uniref:hypothetical protein n=1 Tax=Phenylobacterium sp. TaxID=1871053 RepID=UPI002FC5E107